MPRRTRMCQKPGMFLRLRSANSSARTRHMFFEPLGPRYLVVKSLTDEILEMPATAAPIAARPAIALRRVAADIVIGVQVGSVDGEKSICGLNDEIPASTEARRNRISGNFPFEKCACLSFLLMSTNRGDVSFSDGEIDRLEPRKANNVSKSPTERQITSLP